MMPSNPIQIHSRIRKVVRTQVDGVPGNTPLYRCSSTTYQGLKNPLDSRPRCVFGEPIKNFIDCRRVARILSTVTEFIHDSSGKAEILIVREYVRRYVSSHLPSLIHRWFNLLILYLLTIPKSQCVFSHNTLPTLRKPLRPLRRNDGSIHRSDHCYTNLQWRSVHEIQRNQQQVN